MANLDYDTGNGTTRIVHDASASGTYSLTEDRLYLVGACEISSIVHQLGGGGERIAGSTAGEDGAMLNPTPGATNRGYDDRSSSYGYNSANDAVAGGFPISMSPGDVLVISESADPLVSHNSGIVNIPLRRAIAVHCVASAPGANDFAPPYCGTKTTHTWTASMLSGLPTALTAPSPLGTVRTVVIGTTTGAPSAANLSAKIAKLQLDHFNIWTGRYMHPYANMRDYGRDLAQDWTDALVMACTDDRTAELVQHVTQIGIDLYGVLEAGGGWGADGGHNLGRKAMIMFAGKVLGNTTMQQVGFQIGKFQEDAQAYYDGTTAKWRIGVGREDNSTHDSGGGYQAMNRTTWMGQALAMLHLGLDDEWNHNAYFEYLDDQRTVGVGAHNSYVENVMDDNWATLYAAAGIGPAPSATIKYTPPGVS